MNASSLVLVKLRSPVAWASLDGQPVRVVILLAMREDGSANEHLKVLAKTGPFAHARGFSRAAGTGTGRGRGLRIFTRSNSKLNPSDESGNGVHVMIRTQVGVQPSGGCGQHAEA